MEVCHIPYKCILCGGDHPSHLCPHLLGDGNDDEDGNDDDDDDE